MHGQKTEKSIEEQIIEAFKNTVNDDPYQDNGHWYTNGIDLIYHPKNAISNFLDDSYFTIDNCFGHPSTYSIEISEIDWESHLGYEYLINLIADYIVEATSLADCNDDLKDEDGDWNLHEIEHYKDEAIDYYSYNEPDRNGDYYLAISNVFETEEFEQEKMIAEELDLETAIEEHKQMLKDAAFEASLYKQTQ